MKKILSVLIMLAMLASMMLVPASAADNKVYKTYAEAQKGDLLWQVDFNAKEIFDPQPDEKAAGSFTYEIGADGRSVTVKGIKGAPDKQICFWGAPIKGLEVGKDAQVTMTFKVKANGQNGANNATGLGGWLYNATSDGFNSSFMNIYGNWNSVNKDGSELNNRSSLSVAQSKKAMGGGYSYVMNDAVSDADGFVTIMIEFNAPEEEYTTSFLGADGKWIEDTDNFWVMESLDDTPDNLCFMIYNYWLDIDQTIKDIKFFKGIDLTDAQLAAAAPKTPETTKPVETTKTIETTKAPTTTQAPVTTPATADSTVIVAGMLVMAAACVLVIRRKSTKV